MRCARIHQASCQRPFRAAIEGGPSTLDFDGFRDGVGILQFNTQATDRAVHLGVTEKKLSGSKVADLLEYLCDLGSAHRMGAIGTCRAPD